VSEHRSETSKHREKFLPYLPPSNLLDIGCGGETIVPWAVACDFAGAYPGTVGSVPTQLDFDCRHLPFKDGTIDMVYSAHVIEDYTLREQTAILQEWKRCLRPGGIIALLLPDQKRFEAHCAATGQGLNGNHKEATMGLSAFKGNVWPQFRADMSLLEARDLEDYSFLFICKKN
jgi:ubiquinone/menaquinone biosynthesis C-methylase UbiE